MRRVAYKQAIKRYYNQRVKEKSFRMGEYVLRRNKASRAHPQGKLGPIWEGPYKVVQANQNGTYNPETTKGRQIPRTWNAKNLIFFSSRRITTYCKGAGLAIWHRLDVVLRVPSPST